MAVAHELAVQALSNSRDWTWIEVRGVPVVDDAVNAPIEVAVVFYEGMADIIIWSWIGDDDKCHTPTFYDSALKCHRDRDTVTHVALGHRSLSQIVGPFVDLAIKRVVYEVCRRRGNTFAGRSRRWLEGGVLVQPGTQYAECQGQQERECGYLHLAI